jgi:hypothetical protein
MSLVLKATTSNREEPVDASSVCAPILTRSPAPLDKALGTTTGVDVEGESDKLEEWAHEHPHNEHRGEEDGKVEGRRLAYTGIRDRCNFLTPDAPILSGWLGTRGACKKSG